MCLILGKQKVVVGNVGIPYHFFVVLPFTTIYKYHFAYLQ